MYCERYTHILQLTADTHDEERFSSPDNSEKLTLYSGAGNRNRTRNIYITSVALYLLSYASIWSSFLYQFVLFVSRSSTYPQYILGQLPTFEYLLHTSYSHSYRNSDLRAWSQAPWSFQMAGKVGLEPTTCGLTDRRCYLLSYIPILNSSFRAVRRLSSRHYTYNLAGPNGETRTPDFVYPKHAPFRLGYIRIYIKSPPKVFTFRGLNNYQNERLC